MCNKTSKNYNKFIEDLIGFDKITYFTSSQCATVAFRDVDGLMQGVTGLTPGQLCPSTHKVIFQIGPRRADREMALVEMTAEQYNNTVRSRMTSNANTNTRALAWRNYLIDNNLLPKTLELAKKAVKAGILHASHIDELIKSIERFVPPTHERIVA